MQFKPAFVTAALATLVVATPAPRDEASCPPGSGDLQCCLAVVEYGTLQIGVLCQPGALPWYVFYTTMYPTTYSLSLTAPFLKILSAVPPAMLVCPHLYCLYLFILTFTSD